MWTVLENREVVTRVPHVCEGCRSSIPAGHKMRRYAGLWRYDSPRRSYYCLVCWEWLNEEWMKDSYPGDEIPDERFQNYDPEGWRRCAKSVLERSVSEEIQQIVFKALGKMKMRDGVLR